MQLTGKVFVNQKYDAPFFRAIDKTNFRKITKYIGSMRALRRVNPKLRDSNIECYWAIGHFDEESWMGLYFLLFVDTSDNTVAFIQNDEPDNVTLTWEPIGDNSLDDFVLSCLNDPVYLDPEYGITVTRYPYKGEIAKGDFVTHILEG